MGPEPRRPGEVRGKSKQQESKRNDNACGLLEKRSRTKPVLQSTRPALSGAARPRKQARGLRCSWLLVSLSCRICLGQIGLKVQRPVATQDSPKPDCKNDLRHFFII